MCAQSKFLISSTKQENRSNGIFSDSLCFNLRCVLIHFFNLNISALSKEPWFMLINDISISTLKIQQKNWLTFLQCSETSKQQGLCNDFVWDEGGMNAIFIILGLNILITFFIFVFFIAILSSKNPCTLNGNTTCYSIFNLLYFNLIIDLSEVDIQITQNRIVYCLQGLIKILKFHLRLDMMILFVFQSINFQIRV